MASIEPIKINQLAHSLSGLVVTRDTLNVPKLLECLLALSQPERRKVLFQTMEQLAPNDQIFLRDQIARLGRS